MILYADIAGERMDAFLARQVENLSRSAAQKLGLRFSLKINEQSLI